MTENNDWVVFILLGCIVLYLFMMNVVEREASLKDFLTQKYLESANNLPSWVITSCVSTLGLSVLISQYIPTVPEFITELQVMDYHLNKFGFCFLSLCLFYLIKTIFGYLFYLSVGDGKRWPMMYFVATKFYFIFSIILIITSVAHYYFPIDKTLAFNYYLLSLVFILIFKLFFYLFHPNGILPEKWYYKFLYICTLQIAPLLMLWKLLFF